MANSKPLPALPVSALSIEAQAHRARLIKHFLADIGIESRQDGWLYVLEEVLDTLSADCIREDWLGSIRRRKETKTRRGISQEPTQDKDEKPLPPEPKQPLEILRKLAARPAPAHDEQRIGHLVLCVSPHGPQLPADDSGFNLVPANIGCTFLSGSFALHGPPDAEIILYGCDDELNEADNLRLIGGTFTFKGVNSLAQHRLLCKVLRLAIYVQLSLVLEQSVLSKSGIQLKYARPKFPLPSPSTPTRIDSQPDATNDINKSSTTRNSIIPSSLTNFFLKRRFSYRRSQTISQPPTRAGGGSLDLKTIPSSPAIEPTPRLSVEGAGLRIRRLSFLGDRRHSIRKSHSQLPHPDPQPPHSQFLQTIKRIEDSRALLSASPGVTLPIPKLVFELAEKEKAAISPQNTSKRRLKGDERIALTSILGWDGKEAEGKGMSGILGFTRHQQISFLRSTHVPPLSPRARDQSPVGTQAGLASPTFRDGNTQDLSPSAIALVTSAHMYPFAGNIIPNSLVACEKPRWTTYQYFSSRANSDFLLGEWVQNIAANKQKPCDRSTCTFLQGQHEQRLIHDDVRIVIRLADIDLTTKSNRDNTDSTPNASSLHDEGIVMWKSCAVCHAETARTKMDDGTYLYSFAKYLELLIYSPSMCNFTPSLCEHTTPAPGPWSALPWSRFNIVWHFSAESTDISLALSPIEDIFELRIPRLQITRGVDRSASTPSGNDRASENNPQREELQKKTLRKEIKVWWGCLADHIDKIELILNADEPTQKSLPRLPSMDSAYEVFDSPGLSGFLTPRAYNELPVPSTTPVTQLETAAYKERDSYFATQSTSSSKAPTLPAKDTDDPARLLTLLRYNFQKIEQSLYSQLAKTPESSLNDVRRIFLATALGSQNRLKAWQKKHLGPAKSAIVGDLIAVNPPWWGKGCHAVPGCNIIVRENDWGSIIAHTLSTVDYQMELANISMVRSSSSSLTSPSPRAESGTSSFFSVASGYKLFTSSSKHQPDPDQEDVVWNEPETYTAVISRKETPQTVPLLSIRDVLRSKNAADQNPPPSATSSRFSTSSSHNAPAHSNPPSVKSKPDIALSIQVVDGKDVIESKEHASQLLQELGQAGLASVSSSRAPSRAPSRAASIKSEHEDNVEVDNNAAGKDGRKASSVTSDESRKTIGQHDVVIGSVTTDVAPTGQPSQLPPPVPLKDFPKPVHVDNGGTISTAPSAWNPGNASPGEASSSHSSRLASTLASGLHSAMRFVMKGEPTDTQSRTPPPVTSPRKQHHVLLGDIAAPDGRPHIKYDWTVGKRIRFSCTVYYAKQFDVLRKRCGIQDVYLKSLSKSVDWMAEGGKSKSNFWKTSDDRFIIKTLVNAWNVSDLQVLLDFAPSYFRYMDATTSKPTVLCKVLGFYTIEIKNMETGAVQSKADLLVMENLFFNQKVSKTFDLKGIQGRKVKSHGDTTKTLFDGEWIEGQQKTLTLVRPHSKVVLQEAIKSDAEFLAKSNIMDYSLLLGVDEQKKEISCGLVDTIGSYTFAKTLEYRAKHGLQSGEVTVMPPAEYQERFVNALEGYFVACPDKWSKPQDESKVINDADLLPSVL